jgi:hypothetical protein
MPTTSRAHDRGGPGAAMRAVADRLAAHGFDVRGPDWEEGRRLTITNLPGITCEVTVEDNGFVTWEYWRGASKGTDPDRLAGLAMHLLTADRAGLARQGTGTRDVRAGLQGIIGRELEANGLAVDLEVYADHVSFEVAAEIVVTNPAHPERGRVRIGDEPGLTWECGYQEDPSDTEAIADTITTLAHDIEDGYIQRGEPAPACGRR